MNTRISLRKTELVRLSHTLVCLAALEKTPEQKARVWLCNLTYTLAYAHRVCKNAYG